MKGSYWQRGEALDYKNGTENKIENGQVIAIGSRIGVAGDDIQPGATGTVHMCGVFRFDKADTTEIAMGTEMYWTDNGMSKDAAEGAVKAGYAAEPATAESKTVYVKINA